MSSGQAAAHPDSASPRHPPLAVRWVAAHLQHTLAPVGIRLFLWDGSTPWSSPSRPVGDLIAGDWRTLFGLVTNPELWFGEGYMSGRLQIRGELGPVLEALSRVSPPAASRLDRVRAHLAPPNTLTGSRRNVRHYELGNAFYRLWLDEQMLYTCAYFPEPDVSLEDAQRAKLDLVCRKLRLQPGDRVIEAGCGWGALAIHMVRHYGVEVSAFNISAEQTAYARARAAREGLDGRVTFIEDDYRNASGRFDVFVSLGMLEHVGRRQFHALSGVIQRTLRRDGGRGLLHFIGRDAPRPLNAWIRRRIFPGAYPPTLAEVSDAVLAPAGMSVLDVENLRLHYARTLSHWSHRFSAAGDQVRVAYGEAFERAWQLYLAGSEAAFNTGWLQLFQVTFAPAEARPPYWSRDAMYARPPWSNATS